MMFCLSLACLRPARWCGLALLLVALVGCGKVGVGGTVKQFVGDWAQVRVPDGCKPKQISAEADNGVVILCEDGRVFH